jgi:hypothetical protein
MAAEAQGRRARVGAEATIALLVGLTAFALLYPHVYADYATLWGRGVYAGDEGSTLGNATFMLDSVAHRDFFEFKGPGGLWPLTLAFAIDRRSVATGRLAIFLVLALAASITYLVAKLATANRVAAALAGLSLPLLAWPNWPFAYQQWSAAPYLALAALFALLAWERSVAAYLLWAGVACGIAFWSDMAQAVPSTVALGGAVGLAWAADRRSRLGSGLAFFALGFLACIVAVLGYFWLRGALGAAINEMFIFPFSGYREPNVIAYGAGKELRLQFWSKEPMLMRAAVRVLCELPIVLLPVVTGLGLVVGGMLVMTALASGLGSRPVPHARLMVLGRMAIPASLSAAAVPLLLGVSRKDLSHIAFIVPASVLALVCIVFAHGHPPGRWHRAAKVSRGVVLAALVGALGLSAYFHLTNCRETKSTFRDIDDKVRNECQVAFLDSATDASDTVVVLPGGGFHYLLSSRKNGIPFSVMFRYRSHTPPSHWARAADALARKPASVLLASRDELQDLVDARPELAARYFGEPGVYLLDEHRPGPTLPLESTWQYEVIDRAGRPVRRGTLHLRNADGGARLEVVEPTAGTARKYPGRIDGNRIVLLPPDQKAAAELAANGGSMEGIIGTRIDCRARAPRAWPHRFVARLVEGDARAR